jgi:hypothetical protein
MGRRFLAGVAHVKFCKGAGWMFGSSLSIHREFTTAAEIRQPADDVRVGFHRRVMAR